MWLLLMVARLLLHIQMIWLYAQIIVYIVIEWLRVARTCFKVNLIAWIIQWVVIDHLWCMLQRARDALQRLFQLTIFRLIVQIENPTQTALTDETIFWNEKTKICLLLTKYKRGGGKTIENSISFYISWKNVAISIYAELLTRRCKNHRKQHFNIHSNAKMKQWYWFSWTVVVCASIHIAIKPHFLSYFELLWSEFHFSHK